MIVRGPGLDPEDVETLDGIGDRGPGRRSMIRENTEMFVIRIVDVIVRDSRDSRLREV